MFCLSSLEMLSLAVTASPIKDDPDLQWMPHLFISHTHVHVVLSLWRSLLTYRVWKSPKSETNFWKECIKAIKTKGTCASKIIPIKLYTHAPTHLKLPSPPPPPPKEKSSFSSGKRWQAKKRKEKVITLLSEGVGGGGTTNYTFTNKPILMHFKE